MIVTATGLQLQALGGITVSIDGEEIKPQDRFVYKEHLLEDVPNMAWCVGYVNASWTLRADLTARSVAKLLAYMDSHGYTHAYPHLGDTPMSEKPTWNLQAGYVQRALHALPKSGTHRPWNVRHNYLLDSARPSLRPHRGIDGVRPRPGRSRPARLRSLLTLLRERACLLPDTPFAAGKTRTLAGDRRAQNTRAPT